MINHSIQRMINLYNYGVNLRNIAPTSPTRHPLTPHHTMTEPTNLFKSIGEIAQDTEARPEVDDDDVRLQEGGDFHQGNEQEVEQTESLCMECHEQVSGEWP